MKTVNFDDVDLRRLTEAGASKLLGTSDAAEVIRWIKELRDRADAAKADFMRSLYVFEVSGIWRNLASGTFMQALAKLHLCSPERYSLWKRGQEMPEVEELIESVGVHVVEAARIEDPTTRREVLHRMQETVKREKTSISYRTAREIVRKASPPLPPPPPKKKTYEELERENAILRARVREVEAENAALRERLGEDAPRRKKGGQKKGASHAEA